MEKNVILRIIVAILFIGTLASLILKGSSNITNILSFLLLAIVIIYYTNNSKRKRD